MLRAPSGPKAVLAAKVQALITDFRRHDSVLWRRAVDFGVTHGSDSFVRYSPPVFRLVFGAVLARQRNAVVKNLRRALGQRSVAREVSDVARVFTNFASCL